MALVWTPQYVDPQQAVGTTYTSPTETFGTGFSIVFVYSTSARIATGGLATVTIAGQPAVQQGAGSDTSLSAWGANTTGSGTVVVTSGASQNLGDILTTGGLLTGSTDVVGTPVTYGTFNTFTADPQTLPSLTVPGSGVGIVGIGGPIGAGNGNPTTWTGCAASSSDKEGGPTTGAVPSQIALNHSTVTGVISATGSGGSGWGFAGSVILAISFAPSGAAGGVDTSGINIMRVQPPGWRWHHRPRDFSGWSRQSRLLVPNRSLIVPKRAA